LKKSKKRNKAEKIKKQTKADFDLPFFPSHSLYTFGAYLDVFGGFSKFSIKGFGYRDSHLINARERVLDEKFKKKLLIRIKVIV
jgi:hypothetical protein